jgi:hypothetical protein
MTTTTTDWRDDDDRDEHQRRLADELTADHGGAQLSRAPHDPSVVGSSPTRPTRVDLGLCTDLDH